MTVTLGTEPWLFGYAFFNFHSIVYMYMYCICTVYTRARASAKLQTSARVESKVRRSCDS